LLDLFLKALMNEKFDFECKPKNTISMHVVEGVTKTSKRHGFLWL
jgi:hypothetical protein